MKTAFRRLRAVLGMGLIWGAAWGLGIGGSIELANNIFDNLPVGPQVDMWPQTLAIPGFLAGALFATALWLGDGRRRFRDLSFGRTTLWGALGGVALGGIMLSLGFMQRIVPEPLLRGLFVLTPLAALAGASAAASLAVARLAKDDRATLSAGGDDERFGHLGEPDGTLRIGG
ncbi:MAG TPA: hypothetical protein VE861_16435 [Gemmatimonadaceae bacterium]|nr:hypothetical protein [Gemmatimonadaceae bacterium]